MKDIYKETAGHKGYKRIYKRISCVGKISLHIIKDILWYPWCYPVKNILSYPSNLFCYLFELRDILGYLRIWKDILGYLFGANSQMRSCLEDEDSPCQCLLSVLQLCLLVWIAQGGASSVPCRSVWGVYCTFCFPPDHLGAAQARVHPQLLRQGCQQISGEQWHAQKSLDTPPGSSILVGFVDIAPWSDLWICRPFLRQLC